MYIKLDFTIIVCTLGHSNPCTNSECSECGEVFTDYSYRKDPKVEKRKIALADLLSSIELKEKERKQWFKKLRKGEVERIRFSAPFERVQTILHRFNLLLENDSLDDLNLETDKLENTEVKKDINRLKNFMISIYDFKFEAEKLYAETVVKNMNNRLISTIRLFISAYNHLIQAAITINYDEALKLQAKAQEELDFASNEITILDNILSNQNILVDNNLYEKGEVNQSVMFSMIFGDTEETQMETLKKTSRLTYYYFSEFLNHQHEEIKLEYLLDLSIYRYMGTTAFDESDYFSKIRIVTKILEKAYNINPKDFIAFFKKYLSKYLYVVRKINDFSTDFAFIIGSNPTDEILMRNCIKWYKDLSEGIYKDSSRIIYYAMLIVNQKELKDEDVLTWIGFGDIIGEFNQHKKHNLDRLTEGVEKIIRNAEAHVDYVVENRKIKVRNVDARDRAVYNNEYTYDAFFEITNKLAETIFSIIAGIQIHIYNNANNYIDIINATSESNENLGNIKMTHLLLAMSGFILTREEIVLCGDKRILNIEGKQTKEVDLSKLGDKLFSICVNIFTYEQTVDKIRFMLVNENNITLGTVKVPTKFLRYYHQENDVFKNYKLLLTKLISNIDSIFSKNITNDNDIICLKSVYHILIEKTTKINDAFREKKFECNNRIKSELKMVKNEIKLLERFVDEYKAYVKNMRIYIHMKMLINQVWQPLCILSQHGLFSPSIERQFAKIVVITHTAQIYPKVAFGEISLKEYFQMFLRNKDTMTDNVRVNNPCLCGSGEKFNKCCKLHI